jgi:hypothetical protein
MSSFINRGFLVTAAAALLLSAQSAFAASNTCWMAKSPWTAYNGKLTLGGECWHGINSVQYLVRGAGSK